MNENNIQANKLREDVGESEGEREKERERKRERESREEAGEEPVIVGWTRGRMEETRETKRADVLCGGYTEERKTDTEMGGLREERFGWSGRGL